MTSSSVPAGAGAAPAAPRRLVALRRPFGEIPAAAWDGLVGRSPAATPFSLRCVQEAWWDAYGAAAHDQTLVVVDEADPSTLVGIAPLMHRHELEPGDVAARTTLRHGDGPSLRPVPGSATAVFFGASYHADYATLLASVGDLPGVADAVAAHLAAQAPSRWDVVDLRRLRSGDPAADALEAAFVQVCRTACWDVTREIEEVCPVVTLPPGAGFDDYLATLGKKERHEIRRKIRRAEGAGEIRLERSLEPLADLDAFVDLHQKRWGNDGLFPPTAGGAASRRFFAGLFGGCSDPGPIELRFLTVGGRRIAAGVTFEDHETLYYYNAGVEPDARDLSPGVVMVALYIQAAIARGLRYVDFMRGNEPYKYEWGAVDRPIERILVNRTAETAGGL